MLHLSSAIVNMASGTVQRWPTRAPSCWAFCLRAEAGPRVLLLILGPPRSPSRYAIESFGSVGGRRARLVSESLLKECSGEEKLLLKSFGGLRGRKNSKIYVSLNPTHFSAEAASNKSLAAARCPFSFGEPAGQGRTQLPSFSSSPHTQHTHSRSD